jgi:hypothetical protein
MPRARFGCYKLRLASDTPASHMCVRVLFNMMLLLPTGER